MIWRKPAPSSEGGPAKRVLVIQLGSLAQFVQALSAAKRIREHHVGARITLLTTEATKELAEKAPYFDTVEADGKPKEAQGITKLIGRIRAAKYDMIYDLEGSSRTSNYFLSLRPWPPKWSGPVAGASHACLDPELSQLHPLERYAAQLTAAGLPDFGPLMPDLSWVRPVLRDPPRLQPDYFGLRGRYVLLLPRGSDAEPNRHWQVEKYVELARRIAGYGVTPVVLGTPDERPVGAALAKADPRVKNLVTRADLFQCVGLAERASFAVGDDVDLMHVAAAAGVPCLVMLSSLATAPTGIPRGPAGVIEFTAAVVADLPVDQVDRQLRNCGVYRLAATA